MDKQLKSDPFARVAGARNDGLPAGDDAFRQSGPGQALDAAGQITVVYQTQQDVPGLGPLQGDVDPAFLAPLWVAQVA